MTPGLCQISLEPDREILTFVPARSRLKAPETMGGAIRPGGRGHIILGIYGTEGLRVLVESSGFGDDSGGRPQGHAGSAMRQENHCFLVV